MKSCETADWKICATYKLRCFDFLRVRWPRAAAFDCGSEYPYVGSYGKLRIAAAFLLVAWSAAAGSNEQYIIFNARADKQPQAFEYITDRFKNQDELRVRVGVGGIFSYLQHPREQTIAALKGFLDQAEKHAVPVVVQLDGENWWGNRPDLWNWWDPARPGFSESNRFNVEWTSWSQKDAIKIAWRNWGSQLRVLPPPNLMSPRYRTACHDEMRVLVPIVLRWWESLPQSKKHFLVGIKIGWESSIGVNAWYYPNGNKLLDRPASEDPVSGLKADELPARGVAQIGYAAVSTAGIRSSGEIMEADLAEVVRRHLEDLCSLTAKLGAPRDRMFTHVAGWKENELLYQAALNQHSCPGWSFYQHATDPGKDIGVQTALRKTDAPYWGAVEWLYQGPREFEPWRKALSVTLDDARCRYLCIYNWDGINKSEEILKAVAAVAEGAGAK